MKFIETPLKGAFLIELEKVSDDRGFFARYFCKEDFQKQGLNPNLSQISIAFNEKKETLRGMHYQKKPHEEGKLVRCTSGSIYDVIIDLRKESPTFKKWYSVTLKANEYKMIYLPEGFAHGYQTLEDKTEVVYHMSVPFNADTYAGVRWNDKAFNINWIFSEPIISEKDKNYSDFNV
jgi:dTDP-4-dehydrorhamnose 3,5-epimerase